MNVVGRVGSLISQGVYSVATPFHPFGGAVDIIVVEQPDGSYRSTPWYVRFGKFQGVLKGAEKVVTITVNGTDADFHMLLDNSGQAYFMREVEPGGGDGRDETAFDATSEPRLPERSKSEGDISIGIDDRLSRPELNAERHNEQPGSEFSSYNYGSLEEVEDFVKQPDGANSEMVLFSVDGHVLTAPISSTEENPEDVQLSNPQFHLGPGESSSGDFSRSGQVWEAGILGDFCVSQEKDKSDSGFQLEGVEESKDVPVDEDEARVVSVNEADARDVSANGDEARDVSFNNDEAPDVSVNNDEARDVSINEDRVRDVSANKDEARDVSVNEDEARDVSVNEDEAPKIQVNKCVACHALADEDEARDVSNACIWSEKASAGLSKNDTFKSCLDLMSQTDDGDSGYGSFPPEFDRRSPRKYFLTKIKQDEVDCISLSYNQDDSPKCVEREVKISGGTVDSDRRQLFGEFAAQQNLEPDLSSEGGSLDKAKDIGSSEIETDRSEDFQVASGSNDKEKLESIPENSTSEEEPSQKELPGLHEGLGFEISLCGHVLRPGMGRESAEEVFQQHLVLEDDFKSSGPSIVKHVNLIVRADNKYFRWSKVSHVILGKAVFGPNFSIEPLEAIPVEQEQASSAREDTLGMSPGSSRRWRLWPIPFRRYRSLQRSNSDSSTEDIFLDTESVLSPTDEQAPENNRNQSPRKQFVRTLIPTNEQIASLNLKEGQNMITFSFCTRVLGKQQVDAHIYLWKWNARIVISDVDGTITRSDVLGQVMPLVGRDWSQSGVARLFSAIKENGYQLLFLSARAIVQAYLTKNFLFNLKQDGKVMPSGPVVISPDGLFPSLYREVIRRAPHEFKIACLEDIKALFPSDYNPFYAGFGNRDTDELSYRKIGIPKGKIFIINPKGEVAINSCVDVTSYTSLHTLVNDMFPPTSLVEQEDYNSWNYWKMPLPTVDL